MYRFNRKIALFIGNTNATSALEIEKLKVTFLIKKSLEKSENKCEINIYNLNEAHRSSIKANSTFVVVKAGYTEDLSVGTVFKGYCTYVDNPHEPPNIITRITARDGIIPLKTKYFSSSYSSGSAKMILSDLIKKLGFNQSAVSDLSVPDKKYVNGFSFSGPIIKAIDKVCSFLGLEWSIQNNEIKIIKINGSDKSNVILLNSRSGLIETPNFYSNRGEISKEGTEPELKEGWTFKSLLYPELEPGGNIAVESDQFTGRKLFTIYSIEHKADNFGKEFYTEITTRNK